MSLTRADVEKVSVLARLQLSPDRIDAMTRQLGKIVEYVELLGELDTEDVEPMAHALDLSNVFADDDCSPASTVSRRWPTLPKRDDECYRVPAVLGDE